MAKQGIRRVQMADEWRGLVILLMVFYHGLYDLVVIFGVDFPWFWTKWAHFLQLFIAGSFIILSGMCCHFSRNNLKRGAIAFGLGLLMTLATWIALPSQVIRFGVLHLLGASMMLFALLRPILNKLPTDLGAPLLVFLFVLVDKVPYHQLGIGPLTIQLPDSLYQSSWLFWLGFPRADFFSADYFPLIPWLFLFLAGSFLGRYAAEGRLPQGAYKSRLPWLAAVGRHTIWIYLLHQPVLYYGFLLLFNLLAS